MLRRSFIVGGATLAVHSAYTVRAQRPSEFSEPWICDDNAKLMKLVDHLIYLTPHLERSVDEFERISGIRAVNGGSHPGRGTRNALVALGPASYLEIKGPDPTQPQSIWQKSPFVRQGCLPRLIRWAAKCADVDQAVRRAHDARVPIGGSSQGQRKMPDGVDLTWTITDPATIVADGLVPLLIDWGNSPHPATDAGQGGQLLRLEAEHNNAASVRLLLARLDLPLPVQQGEKPKLIATISCPKGTITLS